MTVAEADNILGMAPEKLLEFIAECRRNRTLSTMVKRANQALLSEDPDTRWRARAVLERMGLLDID